MGIFRQFPYTNFHDLNLDWILGKIKELWNGVEAIDEKVDNFIIETEPTIRDEVDNWLDNHPEATTTVQDHSLDYKKLINGTLGYVFPAMYGAVGDGVADDTQAFIDMFADAENNDLKIIIPDGTYNINELFFSDSDTVLINDGTFINKKLIISKKLKGSIIPEFYKTLYKADISDKELQGSCYDSKRNRVVVAFAGEPTDPATLVAYDTNFENVIIQKVVNPISHFNDLAYCVDRDIIYTNSSLDDTLIMINPETLDIIDSITVDFGFPIQRISYDENNKLFYLESDNGYIKIYDINFNIIKTFNFSTSDIYEYANIPVGERIFPQGSFIYDNQFIFMWTWRELNLYRNIYLTYINLNTGEIKETYAFNPMSYGDETESIFNIGSKAYILTTQSTQFNIMIADLSPVNFSESKKALVYINDGDDLNDFKADGLYICPNNDRAQTLINCPLSIAFRMYVISTGSGPYKTQFLITSNGIIYIRTYNSSNNTWTDRGQLAYERPTQTINEWNVHYNSNNEISAWIGKNVGQVSNWTANGNIFISPEITLPMPLETARTSIPAWCLTGSVNPVAWIIAPAINAPDNLVRFRIACPTQNTTASFVVRLIFNAKI